MANKKSIDELRTAIEEFRAIDEEKVLRRTLGEESLAKQALPLLSEIRQKAATALRYSESVSNSAVSAIRSALRTVVLKASALASTNNQDYLASKDGFLKALDDALNQIQHNWPPFAVAAIEERGLLSDEGFQDQFESAIARLKEESDKTLEELRGSTEEALEESRKLASEIEKRARRTAAKISVEDAQTQFGEAQRPLLVQLAIWGGLGVISIIAFGALLINFMEHELDPEWTWQILYFTTLRLAALGAVASIAAYCLKILRSQLHMFQRNLHRRRLANCIEALVQSASTPEQRDFIYAQLVEAITQFGETGLLGREEVAQSANRLTIDNITRSLVAPRSE